MRLASVLLTPLLAAGCVPTSPHAVVTKRDPAFDLAQLARERVAVWPVAAANVAPDAAKGVTTQYGSEESFVDSLGRTLSGALVRTGGPPSLRSDEVVARLGGADATRTLLDSRRLLGGAGTRFSGPPPELATLRSLQALEGIRYAVLLPDVSVDVEERVSSGAGKHPSVHTFRWARGRLHLAVVDLGRGGVVWEGDLGASGTLDAPGMKQIEEGLATALAERLASGASTPPARRTRLAPCRTQADCDLGVCVSGACR